MNFWDWFPILLWPAVLFYALLCTPIVLMAVRNSTRRQYAAAVLAIPAIFLEKYLMTHSSESLALLFDSYFAFTVAGALCCVAFFLVYFSKWTVASRMGSMILFGLLGPALLFFGSNVLIQDYALSRLVIEGTVSRLNVETWSKKAAEYQVTIETRRFWATPQTFEALNVGDHVRAEIGRGSQYIFRIERIAAKG
jgi:hypothetical protein